LAEILRQQLVLILIEFEFLLDFPNSLSLYKRNPFRLFDDTISEPPYLSTSRNSTSTCLSSPLFQCLHLPLSYFMIDPRHPTEASILRERCARQHCPLIIIRGGIRSLHAEVVVGDGDKELGKILPRY